MSLLVSLVSAPVSFATGLFSSEFFGAFASTLESLSSATSAFSVSDSFASFWSEDCGFLLLSNFEPFQVVVVEISFFTFCG